MTRARALLGIVLLAALAACDPVHSNQVDALGGEAPGVRRGPLHRPGQPCLLCHDGAIGDPSQFTVAGTVYDAQTSMQGVANVTIDIVDKNGTPCSTTTNEAGNFYLTPRECTPAYPVRAKITYDGQTTYMHTYVGRDGSCSGCHTSTPGPDSPGPVVLKDPLFPIGGGP